MTTPSLRLRALTCRLFALLCCALLAAGLLGCGGTGATSASSTGAAAEQAPAAKTLPATERSPQSKSPLSKRGGGPAKDLGRLVAGTPVQGTISSTDFTLDDGSHYDVWTFAGSANERVTIALSSDDFDAYLILARRQGDELALVAQDDDSGGDYDARLERTLDADGEYVIYANTAGAGEEGSYRLRFDSAGAVEGGGTYPAEGAEAPVEGALAVGRTVRGELAAGDLRLSSDGSFHDRWTFEGREGQGVTLDLRSEAFDSYLALMIERPDGSGLASIAYDDDGGGNRNARLSGRLPATGTYVVFANSYEQGETGAYTLSLNEAASSAEPAASTEVPSEAVNYAALYPGTGDAGGRYALLVGIDDYPGTGNDLPSSVADVQVMKQTLMEEYGFAEANIVTLTDAQANRDHILNAFLRHLGQAGPEGAAVFYYSGHGMQVGTNAGLTDTEGDDNDEAIYVWGRDQHSSVILDDELGVLADRLRTDRTLMVLDACHSGTGTRRLGESSLLVKEVRFKDVTDLLDLPGAGEYLKATGASAGVAGGSSAGVEEVAAQPQRHLLLSAAAANEVALAGSGDWPTDGGGPAQASVFTYYLVQNMREGDPDTTFEELMEEVRRQSVNYSQGRTGRAQTPQLEGVSSTLRVREVLGAR